MNSGMANEKLLAFSYLALRQSIGYLAVAFPFVLSLGALLLFRTGIQSSISHYYHTGMQDVFVGTLCAIAVFLLSYKGYERSDAIAGVLACVFAIGIALFPTAHDDPELRGAPWIGYVHLACAALFFLTLIYFALCLFTKSHKTKPSSIKKLQRNKVYIACGYTMVVCLLLILIYYLLPQSIADQLEAFNPVFWLESIAILAFGISWCIKGEALLADID